MKKNFFLVTILSCLSACSNHITVSDWANIELQADGDVWLNIPYTIHTQNAFNVTCQNGTLNKGNSDHKLQYVYDQKLIRERTYQLPLKDHCFYESSSGKKYSKKILITQQDPLLPYSWHMINNGANLFGTSLKNIRNLDLNVIPAWQQKDHKGRNISGEGTVVAILDGPTDVSHEDLKDQIYRINKSLFSNLVNKEVSLKKLRNSQSSEAHGTETAGIINASGFNNKGLRGIAWKSNFYAVNFLELKKRLGKSALKDTLEDILKVPKTDVVNISLGSYFYGQKDNAEASFAKLYEKNIPIIHAAGNEFETTTIGELKLKDDCFNNNTDCQGTITDDLSRSRFVIQVGSINGQGLKSTYSSSRPNMWISGLGGEKGFTAEKNDSSAIVAPYSHYSCQTAHFDPDGLRSPWRNYGDITCRYTAKMRGTSAAAAQITGIVALLKQIDQKFTVPQIKYMLANGAKSDKYIPTLSIPDNYSISNGKWITNSAGLRYSNYFGFGLADASKTVEIALNCQNDPKCRRRTSLPQVAIISHKAQCHKKDKTIHCVFWDDNVSDIEIEDVEIRIGRIAPKLKNSTFKDYNQLISETSSFYTDLSITLTSPSGTIVTLKPKDAAWMPLKYLGNCSNDDLLTMSTSAFYLEKTSSSNGWSITITDLNGDFDVQEFEKGLELSIYGYNI